MGRRPLGGLVPRTIAVSNKVNASHKDETVDISDDDPAILRRDLHASFKVSLAGAARSVDPVGYRRCPGALPRLCAAQRADFALSAGVFPAAIGRARSIQSVRGPARKSGQPVARHVAATEFGFSGGRATAS